MRPVVTVKIKRNDFKKIAGTMPRKTQSVVRKTAFDIITAAAPATPVLTGFLRGSASVLTPSDFEAVIFWAAHYAAYQEFGTRWIAPKLFATGAAEQVRPQYVRAMENMLAELSRFA